MNKILYFIDYPLSVIGGAQGSTLVLSKLLSSQNYTITIASPKDGINIKDNINIIEFKQHKNKLLNILYIIPQYKKIIKKSDYDIIHAQMPTSGIVLGLMRKIHLIPKYKKIVFTDRGLISLYSSHTKILLKNLGNVADKIICTTVENKKMWDNLLKNEHKTIVIGNTVESNFNVYDEKIKLKIRNKNKIANNEIVVGFAGRITGVKNWPLAIEICKELIKNDVNVKIAMALTAYSPQEKIQLENIIKEIEEIVGTNKIIIGKELSQKEMSEFYYNIDIFILTSLLESFGKTALEAMSRKCCVITTNCIGTPEVVGDNKFVIENNSAEEFVKKIKFYCENRDVLINDKENLFYRYKTTYTNDIILKKHIKLYERLKK